MQSCSNFARVSLPSRPLARSGAKSAKPAKKRSGHYYYVRNPKLRVDEQPVVGFPIELEIAAQVQCPLHGARFRPQFFIYRSRWLRQKLESLRQTHHSEQYRKA